MTGRSQTIIHRGARTIRRHLLLSIAALGVVLLWPSAALAQQPAAPQCGGGPQLPAPTNLQVLPKETPPAQVLKIMQNFAGALGVQCGYCHVATRPAALAGEASPAGRGGPPPFNFASDDKPQKKAAREMMLMVRDINPKRSRAWKGRSSSTRRMHG